MMKPTTEGVAMTETKRKHEPQLSTWFRRIVTGGFQVLALSSLIVVVVGLRTAQAAGTDEPVLASQMAKHLEREILGFWLKQIDPSGGFYEMQDRKGNPDRTGQRCIWAQCRHVLAFSEAAMLYPEKKAYRDAAAHGFKFLKERMWDSEHGGWFNMLDEDGNPQKGKDKYTADQMFAVYALSDYYMLSKDGEALGLAMRTFRLLEKNARDRKYGGYFEAVRADWRPYEDVDRPFDLRMSFGTATPFGCKGLGTEMHLMLAFAKLYQAHKDEVVRGTVEEMMHLLLSKAVVRDGELGCNYLFTRDWQPLPYGESYGHELELAWYLIESARLIGVRDLSPCLKVSRNLVERSLAYAHDKERPRPLEEWQAEKRDKNCGGFLDRGTVFGCMWDSQKSWWVQAEALNALAEMHIYFGKSEPKYLQLIRAQWDYILKVFHDPEYGEWFSAVALDNKVTNDAKGPLGKSSYHTGRSLMHCIAILKGSGK